MIHRVLLRIGSSTLICRREPRQLMSIVVLILLLVSHATYEIALEKDVTVSDIHGQESVKKQADSTTYIGRLEGH